MTDVEPIAAFYTVFDCCLFFKMYFYVCDICCLCGVNKHEYYASLRVSELGNKQR